MPRLTFTPVRHRRADYPSAYGWVSTPELPATVSNAGDLTYSIGIGASPVPTAQRMIGEPRARTSRLFNVNLFCHRAAERDAGSRG